MLKIIFSIFFLSIIIGCNDDLLNNKKLQLPTHLEINEVIHAVLDQDSNYNYKKHFTSIELPKSTIRFRKKLARGKQNKIKEYFPSYEFGINSLISYSITNENQLKEVDSVYFAYQNKYTKKDWLDLSLFEGYRLLTLDSMIKYYSQESFYYIQFGTPIFTASKQYVYLESNIICSGLCGEGRTYILYKVNKKWVLLKSIRTWIG